MQKEIEKQDFGEALPDFSLTDLSGKAVSLSQSLEGKQGAVVLFWSSTCSHCVRYDATFNSFGARHPELAFLVLASRVGETADEVKIAAAERKISFRVILDPGGKVAREWHTQQTPRAFLMDSERRLYYRGAVDNFKYPEDPEYVAYLEPAIVEYLSGTPVTRPETASYGCAIQSVYYMLPKAL